MLQDRWRLNTPFGERAFSILLFQDLSIVPLITIIAALSRAPVDPAAPPGWQLAIHTVLAVAGLVLAGRFVRFRNAISVYGKGMVGTAQDMDAADSAPSPAAAHRDSGRAGCDHAVQRSEEHTSELQSLMRISYAVFCL